MIPGSEILHFRLKLLAVLRVSDTNVRFVMRLLLIEFEALGQTSYLLR
jgi:hypothetical protein